MRGRDLGSTVEEAIAKVDKEVKLPVGYHTEWAGEYESQKRSSKRLAIVVPITILVICLILYTMFNSPKWVLLILANVAMAPIGGLLALLFTGTHFSVSSGVGFLALFGVSVQTGVIMLEYINQLRVRGHSIFDSAVEGAVQRLRPIMMTTLVASIGLAAGRHFPRHRFGFAEALRDRDRRRPASGPDAERLPAADALRLDRGRARRPAAARRRIRLGTTRSRMDERKKSARESGKSAFFPPFGFRPPRTRCLRRARCSSGEFPIVELTMTVPGAIGVIGELARTTPELIWWAPGPFSMLKPRAPASMPARRSSPAPVFDARLSNSQRSTKSPRSPAR